MIAAVTLGVAVWGHATGRPWQSMAFLALGTTQLTVAAGSRVRPGTLANPALPAAIAAALALQFAGLYLPFLRDLLHTQPLPATDLLIVCALSSVGYAAVRLNRVLHRDKPPATARLAGSSAIWRRMRHRHRWLPGTERAGGVAVMSSAVASVSRARNRCLLHKAGPFLRLDMGRLQRSFQRPDVFRAVGYVPIPGKRDQLRSYSGRKALVSADGAALC